MGETHLDANLVRAIPLTHIYPSPENEKLYRPVDPAAPDVQALAASIREQGVIEPLVITEDRFILSGHRRNVAARLAGLESVPCRIVPVRRDECDPDEYVRMLREHNRQRAKSRDEQLREELVIERERIEQARRLASIDKPQLTSSES